MKVHIILFTFVLSFVQHAFCDEDSAIGIVYVSPTAAEKGTGSKENPIRSVSKAVERVSEKGGTVRLLSGVYREEVVISPSSSAEKLVIEADEGADVLFDGGRDIADWTKGDDGLYLSSVQGVINLWDPVTRYRYFKQIDKAGVTGWPGSFWEQKQTMVRTPNGKAPVGLRCNGATVAIQIQRHHTAIKGIRFQDYVGSNRAAAISVQAAKNVEVLDCIIRHTIRGVTADKSTRDLRVKNCEIIDVGCGIYFSGIGLEAIDCLILAAKGDFSIREEVDYDELNGIRFYHPAEKGIVKGCATAGFWTGLYQKTTVGFDGPKPFICEGNLFLDGVQSVSSKQKGNRYAGNVIFGGVLNLTRPEGQEAEVEGNYVFNVNAKGKSRQHGNQNALGSDPFVNLLSGDLTLKDESAVPAAAAEAMARLAARGTHWSPEIAEMIAAKLNPAARPEQVALIGEPTCASSLNGAVVTVRLNAPAKGTMRYRKVGDEKWQEVKGKESLLSSAGALAAFENVTDVYDEETEVAPYAVGFNLLDGVLAADTRYEYQLEFKGKNADAFTTKIAQFETEGGPKKIIAKPTRNGLQAALDQALPGDTVILEEGIYSYPAVLSHGGTAEAPLTIKGAGPGSIIDGGRRFQALLELRGVKHVIIQDLQVRHFERAGIVAEDCAEITFKGCRFLNKAISHVGYTKGNGILLMRSPGVTVEGCVFTRLLYGVQANDSPRITVVHNTAFKNLFSSVLLRNSSRDSRVMYNSFTFTGNISIYFVERDLDSLKSLICDYNNYATVLRTIGETAARAYATANAPLPERMEPLAEPPARYGRVGGSKRIIDFVVGSEKGRERFFTMEDWRSFSGKDTHSIFEDPQYADPLNGDFRLLPGSPNIRENRILGAGLMKQ